MLRHVMDVLIIFAPSTVYPSFKTNKQARTSFCNTNAVSVDIAYQKSPKIFYCTHRMAYIQRIIVFLVELFGSCMFSIHHDLDLLVQFPASIWYWEKLSAFSSVCKRAWAHLHSYIHFFLHPLSTFRTRTIRTHTR